MNGGFLTDVCLDKSDREIECKGTLCVRYYNTGEQQNRKLYCCGVPEAQRHRMHWLHGSVFHGLRRRSWKFYLS